MKKIMIGFLVILGSMACFAQDSYTKFIGTKTFYCMENEGSTELEHYITNQVRKNPAWIVMDRSTPGKITVNFHAALLKKNSTGVASYDFKSLYEGISPTSATLSKANDQQLWVIGESMGSIECAKLRLEEIPTL